MVLIPGYWLGVWAWDAVVENLRSQGICALAVDQPGVGADPDTSLEDLLHPIETEVLSGCPPVLVVHSGAGAIASLITDRLPGAVRQVIYVDSGPVEDGQVPRPDATAPPPPPSLSELEHLGALVDGLTVEQVQRFAEHASTMPAATTVEPIVLRDPERNRVPSAVICCSLDSETVRTSAQRGEPMFAALDRLESVTYLDLPTGHWPMWSRPHDLAVLLAAVAGLTRRAPE